MAKRLAWILAAAALLAALILVRVPIPREYMDYRALARADLEPLHGRIEEYRAAHDGKYPASLAEIGESASWVHYRTPTLDSPPPTGVVAYWQTDEHKLYRTMFGERERVIRHRFALRVDGTIKELTAEQY